MREKIYFYTLNICYLVWLPDTNCATLSLLSLNRTEGENTMKMFVGWDKDWEITWQCRGQNRINLENILLHINIDMDDEKWRQTLRTTSPHSIFFLQIQPLSFTT